MSLTLTDAYEQLARLREAGHELAFVSRHLDFRGRRNAPVTNRGDVVVVRSDRNVILTSRADVDEFLR